MGGFFSHRGGALWRELGKKPSRARRFIAPLYILVALAGFGLLVFSSTSRLSAPVLGFVAVAAGLLLSGLADLGREGSARARGSLRLAGFVLGILGLLTIVLLTVVPRG